MTSRPPIFPIPEPHHFTDYGFDIDPNFHFFQVLEEARNHKRDTKSSRSLDSLHFKLQKPISKDESKRKNKNNKRSKWWRNALYFFKKKWAHRRDRDLFDPTDRMGSYRGQAHTRSVSGPVYTIESLSGASTPYRTASRPSSGPLADGDVDIPYISLRDLNMDPPCRISTSARPIYHVT